jgi:hypothetical protein
MRHDATADTVTETDNRPSDRVLALEQMSLRDLEQVFLDGATPDLDQLAGWEFRGLNSPRWFRMLGIKKFMKGFYKRDADVYGYNCPVVQNAIEDPWIAKPDDANPKRFGFYRVSHVDPTSRDNEYLHAVLLDYGRGGNPRTDPSGGLRDYLVQVDPADPALYLGKAYYAIGPLRIPTASFFILERHRPGLTNVGLR